MSQYSWSKRYQIPDVCFKTQKHSYQNKGFELRLRQTIDVASLKLDDLNIRKDKIKPSFAQTLRHTTTDHNTTISDVLGKSYKFFEPRPARQKNNPLKNTVYDDYTSQLGKKYKNYESSTNLTWSQSKFRSMKDFHEAERQNQPEFEQRQKSWTSSKLIFSPSVKVDFKSPERTKQTDQVDSPFTFLQKNKFLCVTPQTYKQQCSDEISTKLSSQTSSSESDTRFLSLKQIKEARRQQLPPKLADFVTIKHLGQGRFGAVSMAIHKQSGLLVALKRVKKAVIKAHKLQKQFQMQMKMQLFFKHPNILKIYGYFDDSQNIYLILEFMEEGTLFSKLKKAKHLNEKEASHKMDDILHAMKYLHDLEIAHRDIKPQNIVLSNGVSKLCDFGWAAVCQNRRTTLCGTIDYAPPQVLQGKQYGITMDLWCLGVLCYELLVGKAPFYHMSRKQTIQKIIKADTSDLKLPSQLSKDAVDFIQKMLIKDPQERMHAQEALKHEFIQKNLDRQDQKLRGQNK